MHLPAWPRSFVDTEGLLCDKAKHLRQKAMLLCDKAMLLCDKAMLLCDGSKCLDHKEDCLRDPDKRRRQGNACVGREDKRQGHGDGFL